jgi:hypothetical protein
MLPKLSGESSLETDELHLAVNRWLEKETAQIGAGPSSRVDAGIFESSFR